jgi:hypothetical protein
MAELISRVLFSILFTLILVPVMCVVSAPYILVRGLFESGGYWTSVHRGFKSLIKRTLEFGPDFLQP